MMTKWMCSISVLASILVACPVLAEPAPIAAWSFDGASAAGTRFAETGGREALAITASRPVARGAGVHGSGLALEGSHALRVNIGPALRGLTNLSITAWVKPASFVRYNEIFRQECPERILFSFQEHGKILSFGLNVGGYTECDAPVTPAVLRDGNWHFAAVVFDGREMRVYLDGQPVGRKPRSGTPAIRVDVPAFVGSSAGRSEFFAGGLDELRVYGEALSDAFLAGQHADGLAEQAGRLAAVKHQVGTVYVARDTFAATLAASREKWGERSGAAQPELGQYFDARIRAAFPDDCALFTEHTGCSPFEVVAGAVGSVATTCVERVVGLVTEYRPLTPGQWENLSPAAAEHWREVDALVAQARSGLAGVTSDSCDMSWVEPLFELGEKVQERPKVQEAVAPYVRPVTPPVRARSTAEARDLLEKDWLHQAGGTPSADRVRDEIRWTRELAQRITVAHGEAADFSGQLAALDKCADRLPKAASAADVRALYFEVRTLKRDVMLGNPVVDFSDVLFVDMPFPQGREWRHETRHRLGYMAVPGARLMVLEGLSPDGNLRKLMPREPLHGSFWRPGLSYDAKKTVFCFKPHNEKSFHLYEIGIDGKGLRQLTRGPYDDLDPIYLPDGDHILFSTTRGHTYVRCMPPTSAYVLARCDRDGKNVYIVSRNNEPDYLPSVMNDGRVVYTRWEYTDKPLWRAQGLWTMNPDGTQVNTLWGNQSVWPDLLKDARSVPGSHRIMFTGSAHHNWFAGSVGLLDPAIGANFPEGLTKVTADTGWPESGNGPVDPVESPRYHSSGRYSAYYSPYPLGEQDFLVSAERNGKFVLYLMDVDGNRELIHEGDHNILHALPVRPRPLPPLIPDSVAWPERGSASPPREGVLFSRNVYEGAPPELQGRARYLRVMAIQPKTYTYWHKRPYLSTGPVVSVVQSDGVKEVLGTVPVQADGSVVFRVPPGKALHFQLLDGEHRALQTMRSFTGAMPGEVRGCLGCHERHTRTSHASMAGGGRLGVPDTIEPPTWPDTTISYTRYVRPVLDRYCARCHEGDGKGRKTLDLTHRPGRLGFDEVYWIFTGRPSWGKPYKKPEKPPPGWGIAGMLMVEGYGQRDPEGYRTPPPMTALSYRSRLVQIAGSGKHHDVKVDPVSLRRLKVWVDAMCPYRGEDEIREMPDPEFQGVDWLAVRPRIKTAPTIVRPGPVD